MQNNNVLTHLSIIDNTIDVTLIPFSKIYKLQPWSETLRYTPMTPNADSNKFVLIFVLNSH